MRFSEIRAHVKGKVNLYVLPLFFSPRVVLLQLTCKSDRKGFVKTFIGQARERMGAAVSATRGVKTRQDSGVELCKIYSREIVPRE